jgi:heme-degrading monooxygenase HmoA
MSRYRDLTSINNWVPQFLRVAHKSKSNVTNGVLQQDGEKRTMIIRVWRGRTRAADAVGYERFLKETAYPDYGEVPGNRGWILLRRSVSDNVEFMFVSLWDSMAALSEYAGGDPEQPKYYPEDQAALLELPEGVEHYQVVDLQARW